MRKCERWILISGSWGKGKNSWGVIITGNVDIEFDSLDGLADMVITPECPPKGERFEAFKKVAAAAKVDGSLILAQVTHPGRQVQARVNPIAISASDVQLGMSIDTNISTAKTDAASQNPRWE